MSRMWGSIIIIDGIMIGVVVHLLANYPRRLFLAKGGAGGILSRKERIPLHTPSLHCPLPSLPGTN